MPPARDFGSDPRVKPEGRHFYKYKSKYGGMEISDAKRLKALENENGRLKRLLADAHLDIAMLKDVAAKKW
jgi:putative transposase